ncbi:hypothetical protein ACVW00_000002 [Marmoricola sp. URHA0025 HA25]
MKKAALVATPLAVVLFFPLLVLFAVAGVGGINQAAACTTSTTGSGGGSFGIGTLNWRGASHYKKNPHPGERLYSARVPNMIAKINASGASIIGFQEFEPPQAQAFLNTVRGQWDIVRGRAHGQPDTRDAIAYQPASWSVVETRYVSISYGGPTVQIPLVRFKSTSGLGDVWVLNTHNPADVVNGTDAMRDSAVRAEATSLRQQQTSDPATSLFLTGDMNDRARFRQLFLSLAGPGWSTANPTDRQIDWIMGSPSVTFSGTVVDQSTNDGAHDYTDHPFVHTSAQVASALAATTPTGGNNLGANATSGTGGTESIALASGSTGSLHDAVVAAAAAYQAGFRGNDLYTMVWIAGGESGYNTKAINSYLEAGTRHYVYGLWQISDIHAGVAPPGIYDPLTNARRAFALYRGRGGSRLGDGGPPRRFDDWSAHTSANEAKYGDTARKAIAAVASGTMPAVATCNASSTLPAGIHGSGNFTPNTSVPYVGPYSPGELVARMQKIMALNGTGQNLDPFFGTEPDGSWYDDCQHFVANLDGRSSSGYTSAASAWSHFLAIGAAHAAGSADGMSPPAGAWLYYGDNHVVVYLGNNLVAGTDTWGNGTAKIGPAADVQKWLASQGDYKGWVVPWGAPVKSSLAA